MMKQAIRKPERRDEKPRNRNPTKPNAIAMSTCMQNAFHALHVSIPFKTLANAVPAESADSNRYANAYTIAPLSLILFL
ncbi:hypothetical protein ACFX15_001229 [Malus domestica]